ncbi:hypothetical protein MK904_07780 [Loigolactobacillus coryniformis]|uniref:hypothetical protein n=1 Tax=Loigolactobacillus coryniformis TaxID=1610 RepID=UPI00233FF5CE|nr:hypothetical protein [Loigolactobacillus coryniformis]MDC4186003.1 hypothetical protein [Loigolactobacillus coryniformis]
MKKWVLSSLLALLIFNFGQTVHAQTTLAGQSFQSPTNHANYLHLTLIDQTNYRAATGSAAGFGVVINFEQGTYHVQHDRLVLKPRQIDPQVSYSDVNNGDWKHPANYKNIVEAHPDAINHRYRLRVKHNHLRATFKKSATQISHTKALTLRPTTMTTSTYAAFMQNLPQTKNFRQAN